MSGTTSVVTQKCQIRIWWLPMAKMAHLLRCDPDWAKPLIFVPDDLRFLLQERANCYIVAKDNGTYPSVGKTFRPSVESKDIRSSLLIDMFVIPCSSYDVTVAPFLQLFQRLYNF